MGVNQFTLTKQGWEVGEGKTVEELGDVGGGKSYTQL